MSEKQHDETQLAQEEKSVEATEQTEQTEDVNIEDPSKYSFEQQAKYFAKKAKAAEDKAAKERRLRENTEKTSEEKMSELMEFKQKFELEQANKEFDSTFKGEFDKFATENPDLAGVANQDIIKQLVKSGSYNVEEAVRQVYGHISTGKKSVDNTQTMKSTGASVAKSDANSFALQYGEHLDNKINPFGK